MTKYEFGSIATPIYELNLLNLLKVGMAQGANQWVGAGMKVCPVALCTGLDDGYKYTVQTSGTVGSKSNNICGTSAVCAFHRLAGDHQTANGSIVFEEPAYATVLHNGEYVVARVHWTNNSADHEEWIEDGKIIYWHIGRYAAHEIGHTLGLPDIYLHSGPASWYKGIMNDLTALTGVSTLQPDDKGYLKQVYYGHTPHTDE